MIIYHHKSDHSTSKSPKDKRNNSAATLRPRGCPTLLHCGLNSWKTPDHFGQVNALARSCNLHQNNKDVHINVPKRCGKRRAETHAIACSSVTITPPVINTTLEEDTEGKQPARVG